MGRSHINWPLYNKSLINRGKITFWFSKNIVKSWYNEDKTGNRGASNTYTQAAIDVLSIIRFKFKLTLRETQGFGESLSELMQITVEIPNYSTLSRRLGETSWDVNANQAHSKNLHVVVDSTGLKVFGEGEWKVRMHGYSKRRTWLKLHLGVNENDNKILAAVLTDKSIVDSEAFDEVVDQIDGNIFQISADGAYDAQSCYDYTEKRGIRGIFPPRRGSKLRIHGNKKGKPDPRDEQIRLVRAIGRKKWRKETKYSRRALAETAMFRFKALLGDNISSRWISNQVSEAIIKCKILNMMSTPKTL